MSKPSWILAIIMTAAVAASTGVVYAGTTNSIPYSDNFENYTNGTPLINGINGWYGDSSAIIVQSAMVRAGTNAAMIPDDCQLANRFESVASTNVWIQMDLRPQLYNCSNPPVVDTSRAGVFYLDSNGNFVVHYGPAVDPSNSTSWVVTTNGGVGTNAPTWVRININENFSQATWDLYADGILVTNNIGFVNTSLTNFTGFDLYNGSWTSYLDNVSVSPMNTNQRPLIVIPSALSHSVFAGVQLGVTQMFTVFNPWLDSDLEYVIMTNRDWVSASPASGILGPGATTVVTVAYASSTDWVAGISNADVLVVATDGIERWGTQTVAVTMNVMDLQVTKDITNSAVVGFTPPVQTVDVINAGAGAFDYTATVTNTCNWLSLPEPGGTVNAHSTNALVLIYSNTAGMTAGTTNAIITIVSTENGGVTQTVNVILNLSMELESVPAALTVEVRQGSWTSSSFQLGTTNFGIANYTLTTNQAWLVLDQAAGSLAGPATNTILVTCTNTSALTVGEHSGMITISAPGCADVILDVTLNVRAPPMLNVRPGVITNAVMEGQNFEPQVLQVWNGSTNYGAWYQVTTNQGNTPVKWLAVEVTTNYLAKMETNNLTISYAVTSLTAALNGPSNYYGAITVAATNADGSPVSGSPVNIPVTMRVNPRPRLALSVHNLSQTVLQGRDAGSQWFEVWNSNGFYTLDFAISKGDTNWLVLTPASGTSTGQHVRVEVLYSTVNVPAGITRAFITVVGRALDGVHGPVGALDATQTIDVVLSVTPFATLSNNAQQVYSSRVPKGSKPADTVFSIWNGGHPPGAMYYTVSPSVSWLSATPANGTLTGGATQEVRLSYASTAGMTQGVYSGTVRIEATDAGAGQTAYESPRIFTVELTVYRLKGFNFEGGTSGASDLVVYREYNGDWAIGNLMSGYKTNVIFGGMGYQPVPGDYFGDGVTDLGVYRPANGNWYAWHTGEGSLYGFGNMPQWVGAAYVGVPGDYDGDGLIDPGVYVEQSGLWSVLLSGSGYQELSGGLGGPGYAALQAGDYDGDGKVDFGVYHRASGLWRLLYSGSGYAEVAGGFGGAGFAAVPADYDGDDLTDVAIYENSTGWWLILPSSHGWQLLSCLFGGGAAPGFVPAPADYNGDGGADLALYDPAKGNWFVSTTNYTWITNGYHLGGYGYLPVLP